MVVVSGRSGSGKRRQKIFYYVCSYNHNRGSTVCRNNHREHIERIDQPLLQTIEKTVLTPEAIDEVIERTLRKLEERRRQQPDLRGSSGSSRTCSASPRRGRHQRACWPRYARARRASRSCKVRRRPDGARGEIRDRLARFSELVHSNVPRARQALRKLLVAPPCGLH